MGQRALIQAMQISAMPELVEAVEAHDLSRIKALIDPMRSFSDATYITVGNEKVSDCITSTRMRSANIWRAAIATTRCITLKATYRCAKVH
ncbi:hypothetical protein IVY21_17825 [Salmonella enterica subsp. enterica serovar Worthington]|nr:hypothetical protein [Salmonella enterica subsp. enterica serovar Worthington]